MGHSGRGTRPRRHSRTRTRRPPTTGRTAATLRDPRQPPGGRRRRPPSSDQAARLSLVAVLPLPNRCRPSAALKPRAFGNEAATTLLLAREFASNALEPCSDRRYRWWSSPSRVPLVGEGGFEPPTR